MGTGRQTRGRTGLPGDGRGARVEEVSPKIVFCWRLHVITYRATLDVAGELAQFVAGLLLAERHRRGTPKGSRALTCFWQAVLGCGGSATAPAQAPWPATITSPGPLPTATPTKSS